MDDELANRRAAKVGKPRDEPHTERHYPPRTLHVEKVTYEAYTDITAEDIFYLVEWVEEVAEGLQWGVIFLGPDEGPEMSEAWGSTSVWVTSGAVRAVLQDRPATEGGVAQILMRADAADGAALMLQDAHSQVMNALNRASDYQ